MNPVLGMVSVVIPVFNRSEMVLQAVDSVLKQTYTQFEIILVDDGSTDETPEVLDDLERRNADRIHVVRQKNAGPGCFGSKATGINGRIMHE